MIKYHRRKDCSRLITGLGTGFAPFCVMNGLVCPWYAQFPLCVPRRRFGAAPGLILVLEQLVIGSRGCPEVKHCPRAFVKRSGLPNSFGLGPGWRRRAVLHREAPVAVPRRSGTSSRRRTPTRPSRYDPSLHHWTRRRPRANASRSRKSRSACSGTRTLMTTTWTRRILPEPIRFEAPPAAS